MARRCVNKVELIGFAGKDPELRYTGDGDPVATRKREKELQTERAAQAVAVRSPSDYPRPAMTTLNSKLSDAEICRRNGWGVGTLLAGDEGHGVTVIRITAVGDDCVLAREVCHAGKPASDIAGRELNWSLTCRDWRVVTEPVPTPAGA